MNTNLPSNPISQITSHITGWHIIVSVFFICGFVFQWSRLTAHLEDELGYIRTEQVRLEKDISDVEMRLAPLENSVVRIDTKLDHIEDDVSGLHEKMDELLRIERSR